MFPDLDKIDNSEVEAVFNQYPQHLYKPLLFLRTQIIQTAMDSKAIDKLEETLKWGEPSYLTDIGSTVRLGWNKALPQQYMIYFHCKTKLVDTFKELYGDTFRYDGNRAIVFDASTDMTTNVPKKALKHCILLSLTYKKIKGLPLLGAQPEE